MMDQKDEVKSKVDIVEVISTYLPLKKAGRNFAGLCPFHTEKTPSFMVSAERQVFKCFGCGEAGDVFTFLEKMEGWDFREALEEMAKRVGVSLKKFEPTGLSKTRETLITINKLTAKFYAHLLLVHPIGESARKYLTGRGIKKPLWEKFSLGFAPDSWDKTLKFLVSRKFKTEDIAQGGLIIPGRQGFYDRFRARLMFPLVDNRGAIVGFAGRIIEVASRKSQVESGQDSAQAKYINSPETPIFNKGSVLFGLDVARESIRQKNEAILVEGEFDVISAHGAGVLNVVASKGTALTDRQVAILARICQNVILCFDADLAGDSAARRAVELLDMAGVTVKVANLSKFKDPDEYVRTDREGFKKAIASAANVYDYLISSALRRWDASSASGQKSIGAEILPILAKITDDIVRAHYIGKLAKSLDLDVELVAQAVAKRVGNIEQRESTQVKFDSKSTGELAEQYFLALLLAGDKLPGAIDRFLKSDDFSDETCSKFWEWLHAIIEGQNKSAKTSPVSLKKLTRNISKGLDKFVDDLYLVDLAPALGSEDIWAAEVVKIAERIKKESLKRQLVKISGRIKEAEKSPDQKKTEILYRQFEEISKNMKEAILRW